MKEIRTRKDYAGTEQSPYQEWASRHTFSNQGGDGFEDSWEPREANPDQLPESAGVWAVPEMSEGMAEKYSVIEDIWPTLTLRQREVLTLVGYEGKSFDETAKLLKISKGSVQKIVERVRECLTNRGSEG